jgi:hypothetical protein
LSISGQAFHISKWLKILAVQVANEQGKTKAMLLDEAITDLLKKYET